MANKYCNLDGSKKIKDEYQKINIGFDKVEEDVNKINDDINALDERVDTIITTPVEDVSAEEIIDARGGNPTLGKRFENIETAIEGLDGVKDEFNEVKNELDEHKADYAKKTNGIISILDFGASTENTAEANTTAFNNAVASMGKGDILIVPPGDFRINEIIFNPPDECSLLCFGTFISDTTGVAIQIGDENSNRSFYHVVGLKVKTSTSYNWNNNVGIDLVNLFGCVIDIREASGYQTNIRCRGVNGLGNSSNEIHLGRIRNGQKSLVITADETGYCTENTYYGGAFMFGSDLADFTNCVHLTVDNVPVGRMNNHHFFRPCLESANATAKCAILHGSHGSILYPRGEGCVEYVLGENSYYWELHITHAETAVITDNGYQNKYWTPNKMKFKGNDSDGVIIAYNRKGNSYDTFAGLNFDGNKVFGVNGSGWLTLGTMGIKLAVGYGSPEGVVTAPPGSLFLNASGGENTTLYVKQSGTGNIGWVAK